MSSDRSRHPLHCTMCNSDKYLQRSCNRPEIKEGYSGKPQRHQAAWQQCEGKDFEKVATVRRYERPQGIKTRIHWYVRRWGCARRGLIWFTVTLDIELNTATASQNVSIVYIRNLLFIVFVYFAFHGFTFLAIYQFCWKASSFTFSEEIIVKKDTILLTFL